MKIKLSGISYAVFNSLDINFIGITSVSYDITCGSQLNFNNDPA